MLNFNSTEMKTQNIRILPSFASTNPKTEKIAQCYDFYIKHGVFDRAIIVDQNCQLLDGYVAYLVAKMMGVDRLKVVRVGGKEAAPPVDFLKATCERLQKTLDSWDSLTETGV